MRNDSFNKTAGTENAFDELRRCDSAVGLARRTSCAPVVLPSIATLATAVELLLC